MFAWRLLIVALLAAALIAIRLVLAWRSRRYRRNGAADLLATASGRPLILAFSTPDCVPCRTIQQPALDELLRQYPGRVEVRDIDATVELELTGRFGILTVPSTVVIGTGGTVLAINHGIAGWEKLIGQLGLNGPRRGLTASSAGF